MARIRHLRNAPIKEAIVDFRFSLPASFQPDRLREARERLAKDYPQMFEHKGMATQFEFQGGVPKEPRTHDLGFQEILLRTEDQKNVAQFRVNGFTFNRLQPYTRWEKILPEALRLWAIYVDLAGPQKVTRVALRYINHMTLPRPEVELDDYMTTAPKLPPSVPQILSSFTSRVVMQHPEPPMTANVVQALEVGVQTPAPTLLFDIDVYRTGDFEVNAVAMEQLLGELRHYKNAIFFESLTESFVETFE